MKKKLTRNIGFLLIFLAVVLAIVLILFQTKVIKIDYKSPLVIEREAEIFIAYPFDRTMFPPEIAAPTFNWSINSTDIKNWFVEVSISEEDFFSAYVFTPRWQPDSIVWDQLKKIAGHNDITFNVSCQIEGDSSNLNLSSGINFQFSNDSVGAPIFFRKLDLPFKYTSERLSSIEWCLGEISEYDEAKILLTGVNMCGNCHSFSADGKVMGIDFDFMHDKGGYATLGIEEEMKIKNEHFFSWNILSSKLNSSSGFLSVVSPNGRYVVSTINDYSISSFIEHDFRFFPIKGVLGIHDRITGELWELPGANDTMFVQCNATWSPDGETIIFAKSPKLNDQDLKDAQAMKELTEGEKDFRFDLWSIPFNNGRGGHARQVNGASSNGKSNYFPKVSPNGKWIVFTQAHAYMLRQLDSKLIIVPFEGGEAHELESNMKTMNSWHSWSPNSKWIAFSTKGFSPYTKIALTHIDENGHASPPVLLEHLINDAKAANLPEFVNVDYDQWNTIELDFLNPFTISTIDMKKVKDGIYRGESTLNDYQLKVITAILEVVIVNGEITEINLKESKGISEEPKKILSRIIQLQSVDIQKAGAKSREELVLIKAVVEGLILGHNK